MNKAKRISNIEGEKFLQEAFAAEQKVFKLKLDLSSHSITHDGVMGEVDEKHFIELLRKYLPNRYAIDSAIIIDSKGKTSDQIDAVIYDRQYTPTLLDQQNHRFIPSEAVYAVFEAKPTINKSYIEYASKKTESVRVLHRTSVPIPHAGGEYPAKRHFKIIAGIVANNVEWKDGFESQSFKELYSKFTEENSLDCGIAVANKSFDFFGEDTSLSLSSNDNSLAYFIFRLLQKLQSLGTIPAVDWNAYTSIFK